MHNLLDPAILFFIFGVLAGAVKSNLEIPPPISRFLALYLLMALGLKGGFALAHSGFTVQVATSLGCAVLLAVAALWHPFARERRWLVAALLFSAGGDFFLAMPWWKPSFVFGLGSFLVAHLCYLGALLPLRGRSRPRAIAAAVIAANQAFAIF